jgi:hypothetical protein
MAFLFSKEIEMGQTLLQTVLQTTKIVGLVLFSLQVITAVLLSLLLIAIIALIITVNPGLVEEREALVTPAIKMLVRPLKISTKRLVGVRRPNTKE